ncbi:MAG: hypothetical protein HYY85_04840 [Deltaproteobacteria bacterium]|nr:hypothetical protein [Deltaproteobacteria bacterium]
MLTGRQFSDWQPGDQVTTAARTVTEADVMAFVRLAGLFEPLFLDREFIASETIHKVPIAPGSLTFAFAEGLTIQAGLLHRTGMAFLGIDQMQLRTSRSWRRSPAANARGAWFGSDTWYATSSTSP